MEIGPLRGKKYSDFSEKEKMEAFGKWMSARDTFVEAFETQFNRIDEEENAGYVKYQALEFLVEKVMRKTLQYHLGEVVWNCLDREMDWESEAGEIIEYVMEDYKVLPNV